MAGRGTRPRPWRLMAPDTSEPARAPTCPATPTVVSARGSSRYASAGAIDVPTERGIKPTRSRARGGQTSASEAREAVGVACVVQERLSACDLWEGNQRDLPVSALISVNRRGNREDRTVTQCKHPASLLRCCFAAVHSEHSSSASSQFGRGPGTFRYEQT
jgi:hypothetical protein